MQDRLDELLRRLVEVGAQGSVREIRELLEEIEAVRRQSGEFLSESMREREGEGQRIGVEARRPSRDSR
jgi:hypothetical protein